MVVLSALSMDSSETRPIMIIRAFQRLRLAQSPWPPCDDICDLLVSKMACVQTDRKVALHLLKWWHQHHLPRAENPAIRHRWQSLARMMRLVRTDQFVRKLHNRVLRQYQASLKILNRRGDELQSACVASGHCRDVRFERQPHERRTCWCTRCRRQIMNNDVYSQPLKLVRSDIFC